MSAPVDLRSERRADRVAEAEQRRLDAAAAEERRAVARREEDERAGRLKARRRADRVSARAARAERRAVRAGRLTPEYVYRRGTLALVVASGLGSLPAQVMHFVAISPMLLPLPFGLEGAAWVMAAGVAYADARHLPAWVRWLLRALVALFAGFAAWINYGYGLSLASGDDALSEVAARTVGLGLAAVTLLGPLVFEIRQWVSTLAADSDDHDAHERRRHDRTRRRHHRKVGRLADRLQSAAPYGTVDADTAWAHAWRIHTGTDEHGMTPDLHRRAVKSAAELTAARTPTTKHKKTAQVTAKGSGSDLQKSADSPLAVLPTPAVVESADRTPTVDLVKPTAPARAAVAAADPDRPRRVSGRVPRSARTTRPVRTLDTLLAEAREATADWSDDELTADKIRLTVRTSAERARTIRDTLTAERAKAAAAGEASGAVAS
ncbi:hypothetical protein GCM10010387_43810 [Streptomyces inusitatus]|uniref:Uncharacterized protein n=1 Tax=Streptomyces inusitatus TaxID=68221 RepID=A0A918UYK7_9ACTN|nr:hypothetical protein [Streptomyces inusitatus]GGZ44735.1 hypothetical protein GCM10010387_43810 [Streptomyces inusitatus]